MSKCLDLRCSRRLTVAEGRLILDALDFARVDQPRLRTKLLDAINQATHECDKKCNGRCSVCGQDPAAVKQARERQARDFRERLRASKELERTIRNRARETAMRTPPKLRLTTPGAAP